MKKNGCLIKNSFFEQKNELGSILVLVPHEDDEINVAGHVILDFLHKGYDVHCAFTTNGDYSSYKGETRIKEAVHSLYILGVKHIYFLGYGDSPGYYKNGHIFYADNSVVPSNSGHRETYGSAEFPDYAWIVRKEHSTYCRENIKNDIKTLLLNVKADLIFCVDCDVHADHRACSLLFEEVMGDILRSPDNTYFPMVFKGFAYDTAFDAPIDFYQDNLLSTVKPGSEKKHSMVDSSCYVWEKRIRFPALPLARTMVLRKNILYKALFEHKSQSAALRACRIINGDAVYWQRRTDSLSYCADVCASSGDASKVTDFLLINFADICHKTLLFDHYLWSPSADDLEKTITFSWKNTQTIQQIVLYGNIEEDSRIMKLQISFNTGYTFCAGPLPMHGNPLYISIPEQKDVSGCMLKILEWKGNSYGLAECEFYANARYDPYFQPFIKITVQDNFIYDYFMDQRQAECQLQVYSYPQSIFVTYTVVKGKGCIVHNNGRVEFQQDHDNCICIRAEDAQNPEIYDEIMIHCVSKWQLYKMRLSHWMEKHMLILFLKKHRKYIHIRYKYLKKV